MKRLAVPLLFLSESVIKPGNNNLWVQSFGKHSDKTLCGKVANRTCKLNLINQLKQAGKSDKLYEVLAEVPRVREDFGYPPLVTPSSQIVGTQAVLNIITGERYKMVPKESKAMLRGEYGKLPGTVNEEVRAKAGIKPEDVITCRPADLLEPELPKYREEYKDLAKSEEDVLSLALFPQVAPKFINRRNLRTPKPHRTMAPIAHREAKERAVAPFSRK